MELSELIQSINIVEYISQYVELIKKGQEWWGLSCFKDEKTPSFSVRENPPLFYDYSSGIGGNVYTFVKHYNRCSNHEAVEILKKYAGYNGNIDVRPGKLAATLTCKRFLPPKNSQKQPNNTVLPNNCMEKYEKREDKLKVWEQEGISKEVLDKFQVYYDRISNRLVYPIRNLKGQIVNIGGRTLDPHWKEKDLRKYTYFYQWGSMQLIYGLFENMQAILSKREIILFEGVKSVYLAHTWGIYNCGALLTSHLNPSQMKILAKLGCRVVFALDKDVNVRDDHNINILKKYVKCEYLWDKSNSLDEKDAPVDKGFEVFKELYRNRIRYR